MEYMLVGEGEISGQTTDETGGRGHICESFEDSKVYVHFYRERVHCLIGITEGSMT